MVYSNLEYLLRIDLNYYRSIIVVLYATYNIVTKLKVCRTFFILLTFLVTEL
jgi:hypothetical protein